MFWKFLILAGMVPTIATAQSTPADMLFRGGAVYTVDASRSWAQAVGVREGKIVFVGSNQEAEKWVGRATRVVELNGQMMLPGFHDSHVHLVGGGVELDECNLNGTTTQEEVVYRIRKYVAKYPQRAWIRGSGWPLTMSGGNPHKSLLDDIVSDRPVMLDAFDGHSIWVNSKALALAGITKETPDPPRGRIERDSVTGEATGTLREHAARLVSNLAPVYTPEDYREGLRRSLEMARGYGITSIQEASARIEHLTAFSELDKERRLTAKAVLALRYDPAKPMSQVPQFVEWRSKFRGQRYRATTVKIFEDGVIESKTAALIQPYLGGTEKGWLNVEPDILNPLAAQLDQLGFQIHIHAIGDRGIQASLDALAFAQKVNGVRDSRHHIAHIQLFDPPDIVRFRQLGVIANFQALWAQADAYIVDMTLPVLGPERSRWLYPLRSVANTGAMIVGGSDWPVTSMNPLDAIQVAVTRRGLTDKPGAAWLPEELVDLPTMIAAYTINGAYVNFQEKETGSIEVGKAADLIVLERNLFDIPPQEIHNVKIVRTMLDGEEIYRSKQEH